VALATIFIACLGLFGLATYSAEQRVKEIGVRKVLGATVVNLASLLSKDFLKLVLIANGIAFQLHGGQPVNGCRNTHTILILNGGYLVWLVLQQLSLL
jgi:predicted lysophospholipase L1 biosynthesis ABC-type transport system permease subunit